MCDYSLHHVASRPAEAGETLVTTTFPMSSTRGFCAEKQPEVAVCLRPGTEIAFEQPVQVDRAFALLPRRQIAHSVARFREVNVGQPYAHHDALEFPDGEIVLVTHLVRGQRVKVLQLPAEPAVAGLRSDGRVNETPPTVAGQPVSRPAGAPAPESVFRA